jgi:ABC-type nitrate/sulfonate/bicarbonate transport system substrate-binding protein
MKIKAKERILNIFIFIGVVVLLFVVGYPQYKESLPSKVRIGVDKSYSSVPFYIAKEDTSRKYFALEKVEAEFVPVTGDPLQGIKNGTYDMVAVPWYWLLISPSIDGDTLKAFCGLELKSGQVLDGIVVPEKSKIDRFTKLKDKRLGYLKKDEYLIELLLINMEEDNITGITKVPVEPGNMITAFENKEIDALFVVDPYRGYMVYNGYVLLREGLISSYIVPSMPYYAVVMRKNFVKQEDRLAAMRIKNAIEATFSYLSRNPEVAKTTIMKINGWPVESKLSLNIRVPEYQRLAELNLKNIETFQTALVRMDIGTCGIKPNEFVFEKTDFVR